jgi:hypothetical protein
MSEASKTSGQLTLPDTPNVTFSRGSAAGPLPLTLPDGRVTDPCGLALALASLSARQVKALGLRTSGIYGPPGSTSLRSATLQLSLVSRLKQRFGTAGLIESLVTWRDAVTPAGLPYCKRVARTHGTSATGSGSLPTPSGTSNHGRNHVAGRLDEWGGQQQPVPWNTPWPDALASLRALDDGLPRNVAGTDAARNAIHPGAAALFIEACLDTMELSRFEVAA